MVLMIGGIRAKIYIHQHHAVYPFYKKSHPINAIRTIKKRKAGVSSRNFCLFVSSQQFKILLTQILVQKEKFLI